MTATFHSPIKAAGRSEDGLSLPTIGSQSFSLPASGSRSSAGKASIYAGGYGRAYGMRPGNAFTWGVLGGFLGAGLGGLLFGGGFFGAMHGGPGVLGVLLQLIVAYMLAAWVYRRVTASLAPVGTGLYARALYPGSPVLKAAAKPGVFGGGRKGRPIFLTDADFKSFEELLNVFQAAWSAHDFTALRSMATRNMADVFVRQLTEQASRGVRNQVTDIRLVHGDVSEAWSDGWQDYATVSMTFSMTDVTLDSAGRVVDGSRTERVTVTQLWSFERPERARWIVAGIEEPK